MEGYLGETDVTDQHTFTRESLRCILLVGIMALMATIIKSG